MNKKISSVQNYLAKGKDYRRWRMWHCFRDEDRDLRTPKERAEFQIKKLAKEGFKAKIYAPLPEHQTSGHTHVLVLATFRELCKLAGIEVRKTRKLSET